MRSNPLARVLWVLALPLLGFSQESNIGSALADLRSDFARERGAAQRWLGIHLRPGDFAKLAESVRDEGDLEVRMRLVQALSSNERHVHLAILCALDYEPQVRQLGERALEELVAQWLGTGASAMAAMPASASLGMIGGGYVYEWSVGASDAVLSEVIDRLISVALPAEKLFSEEAELFVSLSPRLFAEGARIGSQRIFGMPSRSERFEGPFDRLLTDLVLHAGAVYEGFALDRHPEELVEASGDALASRAIGGRWLHVCPRDESGQRSASERIVDWCRVAMDNPDRPLGEGAARALAATGWSPLLSWLSSRWKEAGDRNALAGLLLAAGRGRVTPELTVDASVIYLLREMDEAALGAQGAQDVDEISRAIGAMGAVGAEGNSIASRVMEGWDKLDDRRRWPRLRILERIGFSQSLAGELRALLESDGDPRFKAQALRTLAVRAAGVGATPADELSGIVVKDPVAVLEAASPAERDRLFLWLADTSGRPPDASEFPPEATLHGLAWCLAEGEIERGSRWLLSLLESPSSQELERIVLEVLEPHRTSVRAALDRSRQLAAGMEAWTAKVDRLALLASCLPPENYQPVLERMLSSGDEEERRLELIGALGASPDGERARELLLKELREVFAEGEKPPAGQMRPPRFLADLMMGLERVLLGEAGESFAPKVARVLEDSSNPLAPILKAHLLPPRPRMPPKAIEAFEPAFGSVWGGPIR